MRARVGSSVAALVFLCALAVPAGAQGLSGIVRDSLLRQPVVGAVVLLLDSAGGTVARKLTNERGEYQILSTRGARALRVLRIGYTPLEQTFIGSGSSNLDLTVLAVPSMLQSVHVVPNTLCAPRKDRAEALGLWEQARSGLLATIVSREVFPATMHRLGFERVMDGNSERIEAMRVRADSADTAATSFFAPHSASDLVKSGFATDGPKSKIFFGPDADVLLSEYFALGYCFDITAAGKDRPNQVGLHFEPAEKKRNRVDIDGALWIDTVARALRDIEFHYLNVEPKAASFRPGGRVSFREMQNGVVLIDRWSLRLVSAQRDSVRTVKGLQVHDWLYADETGGELSRVTWPDKVTWKSPLGALRVHAITEDGAPAAGTVLALNASHYFGTADPYGMVEIHDLLPGPYSARVIEPRLADLGIGIPTALHFQVGRDSTVLATVKVQTAESYTMNLCKDAHVFTAGGTSMMLGRVLTRSGQPVKNATVAIAAQLSNGDWRWLGDTYITSADGVFESCRKWEIGDTAMIRVSWPGFDDEAVQLARFSDHLLVAKVVTDGPAGRNP